MPLHPAWAKNISRRVLWGAIEPDLSKKERSAMAAYFEDKCSYCEKSLPKKWHADHLVPIDQGGFNALGNRVPACPCCNEREKQDKPWAEFLHAKTLNDPGAFLVRKTRIEGWVETNPQQLPPTEEMRQAYQEEIAKVAAVIDAAWERLRSYRQGPSEAA